jgi:intein/homing endonuclease
MHALGAGFGRVVYTICGRWVPVTPNQCFLTIFYLINNKLEEGYYI